MKSSRGVSLVELMFVVAIFVVVSLLVNQVLFATFRGSSKSAVGTNVKQNANHAVSVIDRALHSAASIISCNNNIVTYLNSEGVTSSFSCVSVGDSGYVASGSARLTSPDVTVSSCSITCQGEGGSLSVVVIDMTLRQAGSAGLRVEEKGSFSVKTRVLLRN